MFKIHNTPDFGSNPREVSSYDLPGRLGQRLRETTPYAVGGRVDFFFLLQGSSTDHARVVQATSLIDCHTVIIIDNGKVSGCDRRSQKSITVSKGSQVHTSVAETHGPGLAANDGNKKKPPRQPWDERKSEGKDRRVVAEDPAYSKGRVPHSHAIVSPSYHLRWLPGASLIVLAHLLMVFAITKRSCLTFINDEELLPFETAAGREIEMSWQPGPSLLLFLGFESTLRETGGVAQPCGVAG
jgi:hypothetical protein